MDFYQPGKLSKAHEVKLTVDKKDSALDAIVPANARLEKLTDGFTFTEGPVWMDGEVGRVAPRAPNGEATADGARDEPGVPLQKCRGARGRRCTVNRIVKLNRRMVLRGACGVAFALPLLESLAPRRARAPAVLGDHT